MNQQQINYQSITIQQLSQLTYQEILKIIKEKDQLINSFSQQITKYKSQQLKNKKLISSLQQKIQKSLPSNTNTSDAFMIPSQFKNLFVNFITNTVPSLFCDYVDSPLLYCMVVRKLFIAVYEGIKNKLNDKIKQIRKILFSEEKLLNKIQDNFSSQQENKSSQQLSQDQKLAKQQQIYKYLIIFLQRNYKRIFKFSFCDQVGQNQIQNSNNQLKDNNKKLFQIKITQELEFLKNQSQKQVDQQLQDYQQLKQQNQFLKEQIHEIAQIINSESPSSQLIQFCKQLCQICFYMILQQQPWQFVFFELSDMSKAHQPILNKQRASSKLQSTQSQSQNFKINKQSFSKKQFTCIDGFVKEGSEVLVLLKGLRKKQASGRYHYHPNIKNFVLPSSQNINISQIHINNYAIEVETLFLKSWQSIQQTKGLERIQQKTLQSKNSLNQKQKNTEIQIKQTQKQKISKNQQNSTPEDSAYLKDKKQKSFQLNELGQTQNSQLIQSINPLSFQNLNYPVSHNIIIIKEEPAHQYLNSKQHQLETQKQAQGNQQNVNPNIDVQSHLYHLDQVQNGKKLKHSQGKNQIKKYRKQKNPSTGDLTYQKPKKSQKQQRYQQLLNQIHQKRQNHLYLENKILEKLHQKKHDHKKNHLQDQNHKQKNLNMLLSEKQDKKPVNPTLIRHSTRKKKANKSNKKQSVGKIVNQSTQFNPLKARQKISMSQHSTMILKQTHISKIEKQNPSNLLLSLINTQYCIENKENIEWFNCFQRPIVKPKKSVQLVLDKKQEKLVKEGKQNKGEGKQNKGENNIHSLKEKNILKQSKQQRPLALKTHQNNCLVGKLRQKYLLNY